MNRIDFYYWEDQCPHNYKMIERLKKLSNTKECIINYYNIGKNHHIAKDLNIFSPNMMVINDTIRWHGPIPEKVLREVLNGNIPEAKPYIVELNNNIIKGEIKDLTEDSILDTCTICAASDEKNHCCYKSKWVEIIRKEFGLKCLGKLHYFKGKCVGGAEFVPSNIVPYTIPKSEKLAFLTCVFGTSEEGDFKSYPLKEAEKELMKLGYTHIIAIASEDTPFPNGPLNWFLDRGYEDLGMIYNEERHFAKMHLIKKEI